MNYAEETQTLFFFFFLIAACYRDMFEVFYIPMDHHESVYCANKHAAMKSSVLEGLGYTSWVEKCVVKFCTVFENFVVHIVKNLSMKR